MGFTITSSGAITVKAGALAPTSITQSGAALSKLSDQAEGTIVSRTRRKWIDDYANLPTEIKGLLDDVASSMVAKQIISSDITSFTSRAEAAIMLNVHDDIVKEGIRDLKDFKSSTLKSI